MKVQFTTVENASEPEALKTAFESINPDLPSGGPIYPKTNTAFYHCTVDSRIPLHGQMLVCGNLRLSDDFKFVEVFGQEAYFSGDYLISHSKFKFKSDSLNNTPTLTPTIIDVFNRSRREQFHSSNITIGLISLSKSERVIFVREYLHKSFISLGAHQDYLIPDPSVPSTHQMFGGAFSDLLGTKDTINLVDEVFESAKITIPNINDAALDIKSLVNTINSNFSDDAKAKLKSDFDSRFTSIMSNLNIGESFVDAVLPIVVVAAGVNFAANRTISNFVFLALISIYASYNSKHLVEFVSITIPECLSKISSSFHQDGDSMIASSIVAILQATVFSGVSSVAWKSANLLSTVGNFHRYTTGFESIFAFCLKIVRIVLKSLNMSDYLPDSLRYAGITTEVIRSFAEEVTFIYDAVNAKKYPITQYNYVKLKKLEQEYVSLLGGMNKSNNNGEYKIMQDYGLLLKGLLKIFSKNLNLSANRPEPILVRFSGASGVFKSQNIQHLCSTMAMATATDIELPAIRDNPFSMVYTLIEAHGYMDGFKGDEKFVIIDDVDQLVALPGDPDCTAMKVINMIGELAYPVHMAGVEDKGTTVFQSKYIFTTSNKPIVESKSLISQEAYRNRHHACFYVVPADEYAVDPTAAPMNAVFDKSKLPLGVLGESSTAPQCLRFKRYDCATGYLTSDLPMTYEQVVEFLLKAGDLKKKRFAQKMKELEQSCAFGLRIRESRKHLNLDPLEDLDQFIESIESELPKKEEIVDDLKPVSDIKMMSDFQGPCSDRLKEKKQDMLDLAELMEAGDIAFGDDVDYFLEEVLKISQKDPDIITKEEWRVYNSLQWFSAHYRDTYIGQWTIQAALKVLNERNPIALWELMDNDHDYTREQWLKPFFALCSTCVGHNVFVGFCKEFYDNCKYQFVKGVDFICSIHFSSCSFIMKSIGCLAFMLVSWKALHAGLRLSRRAINSISEYLFPKTEHENGDYTGKFYSYTKKAGATKTTRESKPTAFQMGESADMNGLARIDAIVKKNMYRVFLRGINDDGSEFERHQVFAIAIGGHDVLINRHVLVRWKSEIANGNMSNDTIVIFAKDDRRGNVREPMEFTVCELIAAMRETDEASVRDIILLQMPRRFNMHSVIHNAFADKRTLESIRGQHHQMRITNHGGVNGQAGFAKLKFVNYVPVAPKNIPDGFTYHLPTSNGDCGSIVQILSPSVNLSGKIIGLHTTGAISGTDGYGTWTTKEMVLELVSLSDSTRQDFESASLFQDNFKMYGKWVEYDSPLASMSPTMTKIRPSEICGLYDKPIEGPAKMRPFHNKDNELIDPREMSQRGYSPPDHYMDGATINHVMKAVFRDIHAGSEPYGGRRIYSLKEACGGILDVKYFDAMKRATSPGFPWVVKFTKRGKYDLFGEDVEFNYESEAFKELELRVQSILDNAKKGIRLEHLYADHLKDETRPWSRVFIGKTRNFSGMPVDLNGVYRMFFGDWIIYTMKNRIYNGSLVGINPYSEEWHFLGSVQSSKGDGKNCIGGDFSGFDKLQYRAVQWAILDGINEWYNDSNENKKIREVLWYEVTHSRHIVDNYVFEWMGSNPSGNTLTTINNGIYNKFNHYYCYLAAHEYSIPKLLRFTDEVSLMVYGDDSQQNVSDKALVFYNEQTLPDLMKLCGAQYTNEKKMVANDKARSLFETSLLKRNWRYDEDLCRLVAPLELEVIKHMADYSHKGEHFISGTLSTIDIMIAEFSLHGRDVFDEHVPYLVEEALEVYEYTPKVVDYDNALRNTVSLEGFH